MAIGMLAGALVNAAAREAAAPARTAITSMGRAAYDNLAAKFEGCFQGHMQSTYEKCSQIKNLLYRDHPTDFKSKYVRVNFTRVRKVVSDSELLTFALNSKNVIISGTAGAGKTMFMRWAALALIDGVKDHGRVPLYLELRYAPKGALEGSFEDFLYKSTSSMKDKSSFGQFKSGLNSGMFFILLDAIDEVSPEYRSEMIASIVKFSNDFPLCSILMSTRPDDSLSSLQSFHIHRTNPMNLSQVKEVITKLEWEEEVKGKLIERLDRGAYSSIKEFLSNPLLVTILLLTFDDAAEIPTRLTSFYQQAFEVLYQRHDATKGAYKRSLHASLDISEFQRFFSAFCFQSYIDYKLEFTDAELGQAFKDAVDYSRVAARPDHLIKDSMESACLLQKEGLDNVFVHRSFQDYFCANFVANYKEDGVGDLIEALARNEEQSNALKMLFELSPETVEYDWLLPLLDDFIARYGKLNLRTKTGLSKFMHGYAYSVFVGIETGRVEYTSWGDVHESMHERFGKLISVVEFAAGKNVLGGPEIYLGEIWENLESYVASLPENLRALTTKLSMRPEPSPFTKDDEDDVYTIGLGASDAPWLIHSGLPSRFEAIRDAIKAKRDEILRRRQKRRAAVQQLLRRREE